MLFRVKDTLEQLQAYENQFSFPLKLFSNPFIATYVLEFEKLFKSLHWIQGSLIGNLEDNLRSPMSFFDNSRVSLNETINDITALIHNK